MENKPTQIWQIILGVIVIVIVAILITRKPAQIENSSPITETPDMNVEDPNVNSTQLCFAWNTPAGDKALLSMDIRGSNVVGEFSWLPAEKDKKTGIFKGTVSVVDPYAMGRTVNALWATSGEGVTNTEELIIKFGEGNAAVGFGEMKERADGVWVYADPTKLSFAPNMTDTDCGDQAMD